MSKKLFYDKTAPSNHTLKPPRYSFIFSYAPYLKRSVVLLFLIIACLILLDSFNPGFWQHIKRSFQQKSYQILAPTQRFLTSTFSNTSIKSAFSGRNAIKPLHEELMFLRQQLASLRNENDHLKNVLGYHPNQEEKVVTAKVLGFPGTPYKKSILLDKGHADGIEKNDPILFAGAIVGRVLNAFDSFSYGILLTDGNSRIQINLDEISREGLAKGIGGNRVKLDYLNTTEGIEPGMRVVSSGRGGVYPPNRLIGRVEKVIDNQVMVVLDVKPRDLMFVQVLKTNQMIGKIETCKDDLSNK